MQGREDEINVCIACNQACLDHAFKGKTASCLVNPRACHETKLNYPPTSQPRRIAVVGAGPAGLACATIAAGRGHKVVLFDAASAVGGQFNMAKRIPGKEEFHETLRYFSRQIDLKDVDLRLGHRVMGEELIAEGFDHVVVATGVVPRQPEIDGIDHPKVLSYVDVLLGGRPVGASVAIIGAGGIGFDVAEFLSHADGAPAVPAFSREWGIDVNLTARGGVKGIDAQPTASPRKIFLLQRKKSKPGAGLGKTTGWIHRATLKNSGRVEMLDAVTYERIDGNGHLHITQNGQPRVLEVDNVVICAGQVEHLDMETARDWSERDPELWAVVVAPWVVVQERVS